MGRSWKTPYLSGEAEKPWEEWMSGSEAAGEETAERTSRESALALAMSTNKA